MSELGASKSAARTAGDSARGQQAHRARSGAVCQRGGPGQGGSFRDRRQTEPLKNARGARQGERGVLFEDLYGIKPERLSEAMRGFPNPGLGRLEIRSAQGSNV
jgi:hypothetical protein